MLKSMVTVCGDKAMDPEFFRMAALQAVFIERDMAGRALVLSAVFC